MADDLHCLLLEQFAAAEDGGCDPGFFRGVIAAGVAGSSGCIRPFRNGVDQIVGGAAYFRKLVVVVELVKVQDIGNVFVSDCCIRSLG